jgi:hypothetical protein
MNGDDRPSDAVLVLLLLLLTTTAGCNLFTELERPPTDPGDPDMSAPVDTGAVDMPADMPAPGDAGTDLGADTCVPETDDELCTRLGKNCGTLEGVTDLCGRMRSNVACGTCPDGSCVDNVCTCPCTIDGICYEDGAINPRNGCQICDEASSRTGWTNRDGAGPMVCDDGADCTTDRCVSGACSNQLDDNTCLIEGTCYTDGAPDTSGCRFCDAAVSTGTWSFEPLNTSCGGGSGVCNDTGDCVSCVSSEPGLPTDKENCYDELDNDCDGAIDCDDPDCDRESCSDLGGFKCNYDAGSGTGMCQ